MDDKFKQLYCCEYAEESKSFKAAYDLCLKYYTDTERFDQLNCSYINHKGIAIPYTVEERRKCNRNARNLWFITTEKADKLGIEKETLTLARNKVLRIEERFKI
jgi:hypothetical protein